MKRKLDEGNTTRILWDENFASMIRYHRSFKEYKRVSTRPRQAPTLVYILYGKSGVGKSRLAREMFPDAYWKPNNKWWDDYEGQEAVVWDEFKGQYPYTELLRILDSTPLTLEIKGSSCQFTAGIVVFTSNYHPREWYQSSVVPSWESSPLLRRIKEFGQIVCMDPTPVLGVDPVSGLLGDSSQFVRADDGPTDDPFTGMIDDDFNWSSPLSNFSDYLNRLI